MVCCVKLSKPSFRIIVLTNYVEIQTFYIPGLWLFRTLVQIQSSVVRFIKYFFKSSCEEKTKNEEKETGISIIKLYGSVNQ